MSLDELVPVPGAAAPGAAQDDDGGAAGSDDRLRPRLHVRPERGWLNDPNGVCRVDGRYHVFFQHNPAAPVHGDIAWGHASSSDLLHWREEPLALVPRAGVAGAPDAAGCWSGCLVVDDGVPTAVYSGVVGDGGGLAEVLLARGDADLRVFEQGARGVAPLPADPGVSDVRDPFLFRHEGRRLAVQGAGRPGGTPQVLLYDAEDLERWEPLGVLLTGEDPAAAALAPADIWECPNLLPLDGRWVLVLSLWRWVDGQHALSGVTALVGDLVPDGRGYRFAVDDGSPLDGGPAFYAPQALVEPHRVLLWGWSWELDRTPEQVAEAGWAGVLTTPRELVLAGGAVVSRPARELVGLRREQLALDALGGEAAFEVTGRGGAVLRLRAADGSLQDVVRAADDDGDWRLLVDGSLVELFSERPPTTTRAYPEAGARWELAAGSPVTTASLQAWRLGLP